MKRITSWALAAAMLASSVAYAYAQGPGSFARWRTGYGGAIVVDANFYAPDGCQTVLSAGSGTPGNIAVDSETVPVTVVVGPDPAGCSGKPVARRMFAVASPGGITNLVQIFFVGVDGRVLKSEKVSISSF